MKALRDAEKAIEPRRNIRSGLQTQIARLEHEQQRNAEKRIKELRDQLAKAEADDAAAEREIEILKRKALAESERAKWSALREVSIFITYLKIFFEYFDTSILLVRRKVDSSC